MNNLAPKTEVIALNMSKVNVLQLLQAPLNEVKNQAANKSVDLYCEIEDTKITLKVDVEKIRHAILTIVENAIKHSKPKNMVSVLAGLNFSGDFYIRVDDEGGGIRTNRLPETSDQSSIGLGLAEAYIRAHFGSMQIQTGINQGTSVTLSIPQSYCC